MAGKNRFSGRVAPLRIGGRDPDGKQRVAEPLKTDVPARAETMTLAVDWQGIATAAKLTPRQRDWFLDHWRGEGGSGSLTPRRAGALNASITRKLRIHRNRLCSFIMLTSPIEENIFVKN